MSCISSCLQGAYNNIGKLGAGLLTGSLGVFAAVVIRSGERQDTGGTLESDDPFVHVGSIVAIAGITISAGMLFVAGCKNCCTGCEDDGQPLEVEAELGQIVHRVNAADERMKAAIGRTPIADLAAKT